MSGQDILGQDEIDALMNGAKQDVPAEPPPAEVRRAVMTSAEARESCVGACLRSRWSTSGLRGSQTTLYDLLRRTAVVSQVSVAVPEVQ